MLLLSLPFGFSESAVACTCDGKLNGSASKRTNAFDEPRLFRTEAVHGGGGRGQGEEERGCGEGERADRRNEAGGACGPNGRGMRRTEEVHGPAGAPAPGRAAVGAPKQVGILRSCPIMAAGQTHSFGGERLPTFTA